MMTVDINEPPLQSVNEENHCLAAPVTTLILDDRREEEEEDGVSQLPSSLPSPSRAATPPPCSRIMPVEEAKVSAPGRENSEKSHPHHQSRPDCGDEIDALRLEMETMKREHEAERTKLQRALRLAATDLGKNNIMVRSMMISNLQNNDQLLETRQQLEQLNARFVVLKEENLKLRGSLERAKIQVHSFDGERKHAEEVESENRKLQQQVREYELLLMPTMCKTRPGGISVKKERKLSMSTKLRSVAPIHSTVAP